MRLLQLLSSLFVLGVVLAGIAAVFFGVRIFVVQPIGALPQGGAIVIYDRPKLNLVDSPDAVCMRTAGEVTLLCRAAAMQVVGDGSTILMRLPYSDWLYALSGAPTVAR